MTKSPCFASKVLTEIQHMFVAELTARPASDTITLRRSDVMMLQAALGDLADKVAVLEESADVADRLHGELRIALAAKEIVEQKLRLSGRPLYVVDPSREAWDPTGKGAVEAAHKRGALIIDLSEELARERRDAGRSIGPEGGAA